MESLTLTFVNSSGKLMLSDWNWRTPVADVQNLEESNYDYKKISYERKAFRDTQNRSMHDMGEIKRAQELRVDKFSCGKK